MEKISFYRYASIVKNLRGVLYWSGKSDIKWLLSRFRYRYLGVPPSLVSNFPKRKNLVPLAYPNDSVLKVRELFSDFLKEEVAEVLCLSSAYISPVITDDLDGFRDVVVAEIKTSKEMTDRDWKLHMRIADYSTLDFYVWSTENAISSIKEKRIDKAIKDRQMMVTRDTKRYWRICENDGRTVFAYLDPLKIIYDKGLVDVFVELDDDIAAALAIVVAIVV
ncbi:MAG TPA: hypothetical protein ENG74_00475 [Thermoplasmatales archaeon]|nr:hypothetical protein [Thermoplasmatales archaeon]